MISRTLSPQRRAHVAVIAAALALVVVSAAVYLHPASPPPYVAPPEAPIAIQSWHFTSTGSGWVAARRGDVGRSALFATRDGGLHWTRLSLSVPSAYATWLGVFDAEHGLIQLTRDQSDGLASLYATADGGVTWRQYRLPGPPEPGSPWFLDADRGWFLTRTGLYRTVDGGASWMALARRGLPTGGALGPISFLTAERGFVAASGFDQAIEIYTTGDGGESWQPMAVPAPPVPGPSVIGEIRGFGDAAAFAAVRVDYPESTLPGWVYRMDGPGAAWQAHTLPGEGMFRLRSVALISAGEWWMSDGRRLWVTSDAGARWDPRPAVLPGAAVLGSLQAANGREAWSAGWTSADANAGAVLLRTVDGGRHWTQVRLPRLG